MDNVRERLVDCFHTVFPSLTEAEIVSASQGSIAKWDSVATITLVNVIEDEFGIELDLDQLGELDSFDSISRHVSGQPAP